MAFAVGSVVCGTMAAQVPAAARPAGQPAGSSPPAPGILLSLWWVALPALGAALLLAATHQMTRNVAPAPLLWILPLAAYLLTFVIVFDHPRGYDRRIFGALMLLAAPWMTHLMMQRADASLPAQVGGHLLLLFACCMCTHGELGRLKPAPRYLTRFYLCVALGGALGGLFVTALAPVLFPAPWEFHLVLAACCGLVFVRWVRSRDRGRWRVPRVCLWGPLAVFMALLVAELTLLALRDYGAPIARARNFYGTLTVYEETPEQGPLRVMKHGQIVHGAQFLSPPRRRWPVSYFGPRSGPQLAIDHHPRRHGPAPAQALRIGAVGLGVGTICAYARPGDTIDFYEINPRVEALARTCFTYLADCRGKAQVILGDGRIMLERQAAEHPGQRYDVLVIDAFSGDAVPIHLLTREALALYRCCLAQDGLLAIHISNRYLEFDPVLRALARDAGWEILCTTSPESPARHTSYSLWCILTRNTEFLRHPDVREASVPFRGAHVDPILWTDDFAPLWPLLRRPTRLVGKRLSVND